MWAGFAVFLVLWLLSLHFYLPTAVGFAFFTAMLAMAAAALVERHSAYRD
jgi:hypothetical protein